MSTLKVIAEEIAGALDRPHDAQFIARVKSIFRHEAYTVVRQAINKDGLSEHFKTRFGATVSIIDDSSVVFGTNNKVFRTGKIAQPVRYRTDDPFSWVGSPDGTIVCIYSKLVEMPYANITPPYILNPARYIYTNGYIYLRDGVWGVSGTITAIEDGVVVGTVLVTDVNHKLKIGASITIANTTNYDATYIVTVVDEDTFYVTAVYVADETSGTWTRNANDGDNIAVEAPYPINSISDNTIENQLNQKVFTDETELPLPEDLIQTIKLKLLSGELRIIDSNDKIKPEHIDNN